MLHTDKYLHKQKYTCTQAQRYKHKDKKIQNQTKMLRNTDIPTVPKRTQQTQQSTKSYQQTYVKSHK